MPIKSKAQLRLMHMIASGRRPESAGARSLSPAEAKEFIRETPARTVKRLPERKRRRGNPKPY